MDSLYDIGTPLIAAQHQPALLLDHLHSLDADAAAVLGDSGLCETQWRDPQYLLSAAQYLALLRQTARHLNSPDTSFMLGQQALPGHYGAASHALLRAPTLRHALALIVAHPARLSPLLAPHFVEEEHHAVLYWTDPCGAGSLRPFLVEMHMSAVAALCQWLAGARLPWRFCFNRTAPRHTEQHQVHLGTRLSFGCQIDAMVIGPEWLDRPWGGAPRAASAAVLEGLARQARDEEPRHSLLGALYRYLLARVRLAPGLEQTAQHFGISPATLKRRLLAHGTHFQAELDQVRTHVALQLYQCRGHDNEQVARHLGFSDAANFRRSFKRWTGLTPSSLRDSLDPPLPA
jgi:AraC-like DNA-binding protein